MYGLYRSKYHYANNKKAGSIFLYFLSWQHQSRRNGSEGFSSSLYKFRDMSLLGGVTYVCKNPSELLYKV